MNAKITKLNAEREKNNEKISALQARNKEIDGSITELENLDIIGAVRASGITPDMLMQLIAGLKEKPLPGSSDKYKEMEEAFDEN